MGPGQQGAGSTYAAASRTLPPHVIAVANGILNLKEDALHPHDPRGPYLITAVTNGSYCHTRLNTCQRVIDLRLSPAIPDPAAREYLYKCQTIMLGGQAGGNHRGSLLYLLGTSGGGKGNTSRVIRDAAGTYALTGNADAMFAKGDINETLARILEHVPKDHIFPRGGQDADGQDSVDDRRRRFVSPRPAQVDH